VHHGAATVGAAKVAILIGLTIIPLVAATSRRHAGKSGMLLPPPPGGFGMAADARAGILFLSTYRGRGGW